MPTGRFALPREGTYFTVTQTKQLYLFKNGTTHKVPEAVAKKRNIKVHYKFDEQVVKDWAEGEPHPPGDGTTPEGRPLTK